MYHCTLVIPKDVWLWSLVASVAILGKFWMKMFRCQKMHRCSLLVSHRRRCIQNLLCVVVYRYKICTCCLCPCLKKRKKKRNLATVRRSTTYTKHVTKPNRNWGYRQASLVAIGLSLNAFSSTIWHPFIGHGTWRIKQYLPSNRFSFTSKCCNSQYTWNSTSGLISVTCMLTT
jgi:hypothetical protein